MAGFAARRNDRLERAEAALLDVELKTWPAAPQVEATPDRFRSHSGRGVQWNEIRSLFHRHENSVLEQEEDKPDIPLRRVVDPRCQRNETQNQRDETEHHGDGHGEPETVSGQARGAPFCGGVECHHGMDQTVARADSSRLVQATATEGRSRLSRGARHLPNFTAGSSTRMRRWQPCRVRSDWIQHFF